MKLKLDDGGHVVVSDGMPVYVADDGREVIFNYPATLVNISRLGNEAKGHRIRAEEAEAGLKLFEGIEDAGDARKALATVKNLSDKKLVDAGEVDRIKAEAISAVEAKYKPVMDERDGLKASLFAEKIGGSFSRSKFIAERMAIPADLVQAAFGRSFSVDGNSIVAKDAAGNNIFSRARPGELADFDEALETLVGAYAHRDSILKGTGASGGGAQQGGSVVNGKRTMTRAQFDAVPLADRGATIREITLVD